ncbi:STAS domain-containing protein [Cronbergia sp. UHCC 0137]|uniref:STAS domain-containing protein n=1 Tax=Cronbergia sp. UHCC 0137 TaxID=3110239 RepID=UPI002B1EA554|nr:STAS domain-containing protein [Cronbergia sp. UHCC 0137]MEA5617469.1 STAS domain-containing protein [Cronbergia sp. UHCC 0137]
MNLQVKVIQPQGIFNSKSGNQIRQEVDDLIASEIKTILIDFKDVTFMDSSGFSALLMILKTVRQKNTRLVLCSVNDQIKMIFDMTNTSNHFEVLSDQTSFVT